MNQCPYCGSSEGYYTKEQVRGSIRFRHHFDGSEADNGDMHDNLIFKGGKFAYCLNCNKKLFQVGKTMFNRG